MLEWTDRPSTSTFSTNRVLLDRQRMSRSDALNQELEYKGLHHLWVFYSRCIIEAVNNRSSLGEGVGAGFRVGLGAFILEIKASPGRAAQNLLNQEPRNPVLVVRGPKPLSTNP